MKEVLWALKRWLAMKNFQADDVELVLRFKTEEKMHIAAAHFIRDTKPIDALSNDFRPDYGNGMMFGVPFKFDYEKPPCSWPHCPCTTRRDGCPLNL